MNHEDLVSSQLYSLSEALAQKNPENQSHGLLGGKFGYGQEFENDVFMMHPYYWGDCTCGGSEPIHKDDCDIVTKLPEWISNRFSYADKDNDGIVTFGSDDWNAIENMDTYEELCPAPKCSCGATENFVEGECNENCLTLKPNFEYKKTELKVTWYKYIGRGMEISDENISVQEINEMFNECLKSIAIYV